MDLSNYSYDAIIFDCDGTLVNTASVHFEAFRLALLDQGATIERSWYNQRLSFSSVDLITEFKENVSSSIDVSTAITSSELNFLKLVHLVEPIPEIVSIVLSHWQLVPMGVASSGQRLNVFTSLQSVGLFEKFDSIVTAEDVRNHKPAPDSYLKATEKLGVPSERCLVFEDTDEGLEAAFNAGINAIDVRTFASIYA